MNKQEAGVVVNKIVNLYKTQCGKYSRQELGMMVETWADIFKDDPLDSVLRAVTVYANRGVPFAPNPPDIIKELQTLEDYGGNGLFNKLRKAAQIAAEGEEHIVLDDLGGVYQDETSPTGWRFRTPEAHVSVSYSQADFANLPRIIQEYAEDIPGLVSIYHEIASNPVMARKRFVDRVPYIRASLEVTE